MKTYKNLYAKLCSKESLVNAYNKAKKGKAKKKGVIEFTANLDANLDLLRKELLAFNYNPKPLRKFIVRDPKTRKIHASAFRDRIVHHAVINVLNPIYDKVFIYDSFASRKKKGSHNAVKRFDYFKRKVSSNGKLVKNPFNNNMVKGYVLKTDIKHYFENVNHEILIGILRRKIKDESLIWLIKKILDNFEGLQKGKGMPLGNYTSQFFANIYLNELDYFVKHRLKAKYYIRYVDDFVILHKDKKILDEYLDKINKYLLHLKIQLHPDKSKIIPLSKGTQFLGYRIFYYHKLLRKRNLNKFKKEFEKQLELYKTGILSKNSLIEKLQGWFGYALRADTYKLRKEVFKEIEIISQKI